MPHTTVLPPILACIEYPPSLYDFSISDILTFISWFAATGLGVYSALYIDKRKSINSVLSQIEIIKDLIAASEDGRSAYKSTFEDIKTAIFASMPLIPERKAIKVREAWSEYRGLDFSKLDNEVDSAKSIADRCVGIGKTPAHEEVLRRISTIEQCIK